MAVRKLKGSWWVDFQFRKQRIRRRSPLNTKAGAQEYEVLLRSQTAKHGAIVQLDDIPRSSAMREPTLGAFAEQWLRDYVDVNNGVSERYNKRKTLKAYLLPAFGDTLLSGITAPVVERFKAQLLGRGLCAKSINNHLTVLKRCLGCAVEWNIIAAAPRFKLLKTTPPSFRYLKPEEADRLLDAASTPLLHAMVRTALRTGLRFSELIALRWEDVDLADRQICVRRAEVRRVVGPTKNGRIRYIPINHDLVDTLSKLERTADLVFHRDGRSLRRTTMAEQLALACAVAEVPAVGWHALRHTYASHLVAAGAPLAAIRELLGHSTIEMTLRYAHLAPSAIRAAVDLLATPQVGVSTWRQPTPATRADGEPRVVQAPESERSTRQKDTLFRECPCMVGVDGVEPAKPHFDSSRPAPAFPRQCAEISSAAHYIDKT